MKYAVEMDTGAMIYIRSFVKIASGIQKLILGGIYRHHSDCISPL
jgi:high-affinity Fe2+/Pb2+ permease